MANVVVVLVVMVVMLVMVLLQFYPFCTIDIYRIDVAATSASSIREIHPLNVVMCATHWPFS